MRGVWGERGVGVCGMKGVKGCDSRVRYRNDKGGRDLVTYLNTARNKIRKINIAFPICSTDTYARGTH